MKVVRWAQRAALIAIRSLWRNLDVVVLLLLMAAVFNWRLSFSDQPIPRETFNALDESWELDLVYKASQGVWSGRDFMWTYGPLWQYLASLLPRAGDLSAGRIFSRLYLFNFWGSFLLAFAAGRLLLAGIEAWRRAVFLFALVAFWLPIDVRAGCALFAFAVYLRLVENLPGGRAKLLGRCAGASLLLAASFLIAMDAGALSATALAVVAASSLLLNWRTPARNTIFVFAAGTGACMLLWVLVVNLWAGGLFNFQFWTWSLRMTSQYRWLMPYALNAETAARLAWTTGACALIFVMGWLLRDSRSQSVTMRPLFLVAGALFGCVALQKGVVRSGWGQISQAMLPAIALSGMILAGYRSAARTYLPRIAVLSVVALTLFFSGPGNLFGWSGIVGRTKWKAPPYPYCPPDLYYLDQACFPQSEYGTFGVPAEYVRAHSVPADALVVFPFENAFGVFSKRRVTVGVLQNYAIGGDYFMNLQIAALERERPPLGIYCSDGIVSWPVDGISNFQRAAPVWLYLQSHYAAEAEPANGVVVLRRDETRAANSVRIAHELWRPAGPSSGTSATIDPARWAMVRTDFLRLNVRVQYSPLWKIAKPSAVFATVRFADGTFKEAKLSIEPDRPVEVWIYPWEEINLRNYFRPDAGQWRPSGPPLPAVQSVHLRTQPYDFLSATPRQVAITAVDGVELGLKDSTIRP